MLNPSLETGLRRQGPPNTRIMIRGIFSQNTLASNIDIPPMNYTNRVAESVIGKKIDRSRTSKFNVLLDDPKPPHFYKWVFSKEYPQWPTDGISKWRPGQLSDCEAALEFGQLKAVRTNILHSTAIDASQHKDHKDLNSRWSAMHAFNAKIRDLLSKITR